MARWHSCNVLHVGANSRQLWQFDARSANFKLERDQAIPSGQPLPPTLVAKNWRSLWQKKLNVAWLPPEKVFLRVLQLPKADFTETVSMVDFQLEKISPLPVAQIVWSVHVLPQTQSLPREGETAAEELQTVIVTIVSRNLVEEFLGDLEKEGFLADRLEVPMLDRLAMAQPEEDGAWIYPDLAGHNSALVAWWYGGKLQSLGLIQPAAGEQRAESLREQLTQMTWAGELDGWLTSSPRWHLVADATVAEDWSASLRKGLDQPVEIIAPQKLGELALATARRAAQADGKNNLLPAEYSTRYRQQFVDRLWMRGLGAVVGVYLLGILIYFAALQVLSFRTDGVEDKVAGLSQSYTNAIQLKARYQILKDRSELKFAALECWKTAAELMPDSITLQGLDFVEGRELKLMGNVTKEQYSDLIDFSSALAKATINGQPLFKQVETPNSHTDSGGNTMSWSFVCRINHAEAE